MGVVLYFLVGVLTVIAAVLGALYARASAALRRYQGIADAEAYKAECAQQAELANQQVQQLVAQSQSLNAQLAADREKIARYQTLLGNLKTAADLQQRIQKDTARAQHLANVIGKLERASQLDDYLRGQQEEIARKQAELESIAAAIGSARSASEIAAQVAYYENYLAVLKADIEVVEETRELHEFAFYRPHYNFDTTAEYQVRLEQVRDRQKKMLTQKTACVCTTEWTVEGSKREGQKMVDQHIKLMLRAFNGECDAAVGKVRYNNVVNIENRVRRAFEQINKLGQTKRIHLAEGYLHLKLEELHLAYEQQQKKEEEREQQRLIREQMREEEKVAREIEKVCETAEREEGMKARALEKAREELAQRTGKQTEKLEALVAKLEQELQDAIDRKAKAIARAQLTKSGHVYILSNIGAFGEDVYKIGMSRRLEPLERVAELGGASVPFPFDVHAMIYSEDAPALEAALHRHFADRRVNLVNLRREFFRVTLDEIRAAVAQHFGHVTFVTVPEAAQYYQTLALRKEMEREESSLQIA